jgi:hypothetical protein
MKAIDILQEQWQQQVIPALTSLGIHGAIGAGLYFGDKKSNEKKPETAVTPTPLEKPADKKVPQPKKEITKTTGKQDVLSPEFSNKVKVIADNLGVKTSDLLRIMQFESGLNPASGPNSIGAVGLIQFKPETAESLGTTTDALLKMTAVEQLDYVEKFYRKNGVKAGMGLGELYLLTYMPAAVSMSKDNNFVLGVDPKSKDWNDVEKYGKPFPRDKTVTRANNWIKNPSFTKIPLAEKPPRDYFTVGDVKNFILGVRH